MDEKDQTILRNIQTGIQLVKEPFLEIAKKTGMSQDEIIDRLKRLVRKGVIRRFGISISHRKIGIVENAVVAWEVPRSRMEAMGKMMANYEEITHVYERETVPGMWKYNLYAVIHDCERKFIIKFIESLSDSFGLKKYLILFSIKQFKKSSIMLPERIILKEP